MKRRSLSIEERLNHRAYQRLANAPALWKEYCLAQMARQMTFAQFLTKALTLIGVAVPVLAFPLWFVPQTDQVQGHDGLLAVQSIVSTLTTLYLANLMRALLQGSRFVTVYSHLPITDRAMGWKIYQQQSRPLISICYVHACIYLYLANQPQFGWGDWGSALPMIAGQVIVYWATATILLRYVPPRVLNINVFRFTPLLVLGFCWPTLRLPQVAIDTTLLVLPSGWLNAIWLWGGAFNGKHCLWLLLPFGAWCGWAAWCMLSILDRYRIRQFNLQRGQEAEIEGVGSVLTKPSPLLQLADEAPEQSPAVILRNAREKIRTRRFVDGEDWSQLGMIECLVYFWLTPRERVIIETLTSGCINWTSTWWVLAWVSVGTCLMVTVLNWGEIVWYVQLCLSFAYLTSGMWPAFRLRNCGGNYVSQIYGLPLGLDETFATFMKVALVRIFAATIVWGPIIVLITTRLGQPLMASLPIGIATVVVAVAISIWAAFFLFGISAEFSSGERKFFWFVGLNILFLSCLGGTFYTVVSAQMPDFVPRVQQMGWGLSVVMTATSLNWLLFRTIYRYGAIDLVVFQTPHSERHFAAHELSEIAAARKIEQRRAKRAAND